ncbi:hypothetical protein [uncultured Merdimonas sp.]|uniref:hypothetical protein n=1 Tax=uncultured Merdimonas sp. TaxID=2023269 RepID=UPI00320B7A16
MTQEMQERELDWKQEKSRSFSHQSLTDLVRVYGVCGLIGREGEQKEESFPHIVKNLIREMEEQEVEACLPGRNQSVRRHQDPVRIFRGSNTGQQFRKSNPDPGGWGMVVR